LIEPFAKTQISKARTTAPIAPEACLGLETPKHSNNLTPTD